MNLYHSFINYLAKRIKNVPFMIKRKYLENKGLLFIGKHTYGYENIDFHIYKGSECNVRIGKYCSIGPDVRIILGGIHPSEWVSLYPFRINFDLESAFKDGMPKTKGDISIGNDVWIGTGVTILSGVKIGNGAVVAAGSLVTKDIEPFSIDGGIPNKTIRKRFSDEIISELQTVAWWNWEDKDVLNAVEYLSNGNIEAFLEKYRVSNG